MVKKSSKKVEYLLAEDPDEVYDRNVSEEEYQADINRKLVKEGMITQQTQTDTDNNKYGMLLRPDNLEFSNILLKIKSLKELLIEENKSDKPNETILNALSDKIVEFIKKLE